MSNPTLAYKSELNADIILMAVERVAEDLQWQIVDEAPGKITPETPEGYAKHTMKFEISAWAASEGGANVSMEGHVSGLFSDKSSLMPEMEQLKPKIEAVGQELTQQAIDEGYMCPTCGTLVPVGLLRCPKDGTPMKRKDVAG